MVPLSRFYYSDTRRFIIAFIIIIIINTKLHLPRLPLSVVILINNNNNNILFYLRRARPFII